MKRLTILFLMVLLAACAQQGAKEKTVFQDVRSETLQQSVQVQISLGREKLELGKSPEEQLWERAEKKGVREAVNPWIEQGYLIRPSRANVLDEGFSDFLVHKGDYEVEAKEITQVYSKQFDVNVRLTPVEQASGEVTAIEAKRSMAAGNFHVSLKLNDLTPDDQGAYFVVVQTDTALDDSEHGKIVGSGRIYRVLEDKAQATLMETKQEIQEGDLVFLLRTEIAPVSTEDEEQEAEEEETEPRQPEVLVEPKKEPREPEPPKETK